MFISLSAYETADDYQPTKRLMIGRHKVSRFQGEKEKTILCFPVSPTTLGKIEKGRAAGYTAAVS